MLQDLEEDHRIKAVVLRINSGGGDAGASDRIYHAVKRLDAVNPVIALFDSVAASGGYYIGCGAREIVVHRATVTGSIGVFALVPDFQGTCDKLGLSTFVLNSDPRADLFSGLAFTPEKEKALGKIITDVDQRFQGVVAKARKMSSASIAALADGKVYIGEDAIALGLADRLGTLADTAVRARTLAGFIKPLAVERYPEQRGLMQMLERLGGASTDNLPKVAAKILGGKFAATFQLLNEPGQIKILAWTQTPTVR
jgi:protease-4